MLFTTSCEKVDATFTSEDGVREYFMLNQEKQTPLLPLYILYFTFLYELNKERFKV